MADKRTRKIQGERKSLSCLLLPSFAETDAETQRVDKDGTRATKKGKKCESNREALKANDNNSDSNNRNNNNK